MQLIADSGSTKTEWVILHKDSKQRVVTSGINPFFESTKTIFDKLSAEWTDNKITPKEIHFYGAGCANAEKNEVVTLALQQFFQSKNISVNSDLLGAARSLCFNSEGIACILGTGANSCHFNGTEIIKNVSPLGFILGDEGSGAVIGKTLLADILKKQLPSHIINLFFEETKLEATDILNAVYKKPFPNRYMAQFTKFIKSHTDIPELESIVLRSFDRFISRNLLQYDKVNKLPIHFTGSIAFHFKKQLEQALEERGLQAGTINSQPMDGLITFHTK